MSGNLMRFATGMVDGSIEESRKDVLRDIIKNRKDEYIVDTVCAVDTGKWETGICKNDGRWVIVEKYRNKIDAITGHQKWVKECKKPPPQIKEGDGCGTIDWFFGDDEEEDDDES